MVDILALSIAHGVLALTLWRLIGRADLDSEIASDETKRKGRKRA